jgi:GNAT superfamily N-acetyltransferase/predicted nucleotidyltransferase
MNNLEIPFETKKCIEELRDLYIKILDDNISGIYIHGSIAMRCFNVESSDVDVLVTVKKNLPINIKHELGRIHLTLSDKFHQNIELSVVTDEVLEKFMYPTPFEFHYSDDHKEAFASDTVDLSTNRTDHDLAAHFVIAKKYGITLFGKPANDAFPTVPNQNYLDSIARDSEWSYNNIIKGSDEGNCFVPKYAVLNFCRVLAFIKSKLISSKKTGAEWALVSLPEEFKPVIQEALKEYTKSGSSKEISCKTLKHFAQYAKTIIDNADRTNQPISLRLATISEWQKVVDIYSREGLPDEVELVSKELPMEFAEIGEGMRKIWLIEKDEAPIGTIQLVFMSNKKPELANGKDTAMIHHLRVSKEYENQGIASLLNKTVTDEAKKDGIKFITLEVEKMNDRARKIYEHWGYEYWKDGIDPNEIVLRKKV